MLPIFHVGCFKQSSAVAEAIRSLDQVRSGPPEAVNINESTFDLACPSKHWKIALCSLSIGKIATLYSLASAVIKGPPATNVSLLARPIVLRALMASTVGSIPTAPTIAVTTIVAS